MNIDDRPNDLRPTDLIFLKISRGHSSATRYPIHFMRLDFRMKRKEWESSFGLIEEKRKN